MTLNQLIEKLEKLVDDGHGDLQIMTTNGASGCCDPLSSPYLRYSSPDDIGELCEWDEGTPYIDIYNGN